VAAEPNLITFSKIDRAWEYSRGDNTKVAVVDWCFDMSEAKARKYVDAVSLVPGEPVGADEPWHGEWMAEIVHKVAPKAKIIPIRARPSSEKGEWGTDGRAAYEKYLIEGIRYAADHGAAAVTNSMGPVTQCKELEEAIDYAEQRGTIFVDVHPEYAKYTKESMRPAEPNQLDKRIIRSGVVSVPKHAAKPEARRNIYVWPYEIEPVFKDGWGYSNGPPIVAGVIALMRSANRNLTPQEIRTIISQTAYIKDGFKVLDAEAAVKEAMRKIDG
jgi:hypothetical protein